METKTIWKPWKVVGGLLAPLVLLAVLPVSANANPRPGTTERVSVASDGAEANSYSSDSDISADGRYVAFRTFASNLVPDDTNETTDVFVHDRDTGATERVTVASDGTEANDASTLPTLSADGRYVAFMSRASNLVPGDTNGLWDVFVHDRATGTTERVSVASDGAQASGPFGHDTPAISADGRYVVFASGSSNLVPGDTNGDPDVFVHDRATGTTERVNISSDGAEADAPFPASLDPAINADGRYVAFQSDASNLVPGDTNGKSDIFVHDRDAGTTERVSVASDDAQGNSDSFTPALSADGRHVAFQSAASNLVPGDTNGGAADVFVHDRDTGTTERVSVTSDGTQANFFSFPPDISADGRHVAFMSFATNLVPGDTNGEPDFFVHDRAAGATERVNVASDGAQANGVFGGSGIPAISADGRLVAFESTATNLVPGDTNGEWDVFVRDRGGPLGILGPLSVVKVPGGVAVSGRATFKEATLAGASDPNDDGTGAGPLGAADVGAELIGAALIYVPEQEELLLWLDLSSRWSDPAATGPPGVLFGADLRVGDTRYEVRALRTAATALPLGAPHVALYRCDPVCTEHARLTGSFKTTGKQVRVSVPLAALEATEGTELTDLRAFTAAGEATPGAIVPLDEVPLSSAVIPASRVELGIAPASTPEEEVAFTVEADLAAGDFSGTIPTAGLSPGSYRVWARACVGDACGPAAAAPVTLGDETSPSPSPSATSTESPTPTPTESPAPDTTEVAFTEDSATAGQHTDPTRFAAHLADSDGDPIEGATLTFTLTGEESLRDFTATTDQEGLAAVTPTLEEKPGPYQLTVRFAGDEDHLGDADTVSFVVDKEDSALALSVEGEDEDKTLSARLSDLDTASEGVPGRTIDFYSDGELIGSGVTNADGLASLALPAGHRGNNRTYEAVFAGDDFYLGSSDEKAGKGGKGGNGGGVNGGGGTGGPGAKATYAGKMLLM